MSKSEVFFQNLRRYFELWLIPVSMTSNIMMSSIKNSNIKESCDSKVEHPTSCSSKKVFLSNFHLAGKIWGTPHNNNRIIVYKIWNTSLFIWEIVFIQQPNNKVCTWIKYLNVICRYNYLKRCSFSSPSWLDDGNSSAGC